MKVKQTFCCHFKIDNDEGPKVGGLNGRARSEIKNTCFIQLKFMGNKPRYLYLPQNFIG